MFTNNRYNDGGWPFEMLLVYLEATFVPGLTFLCFEFLVLF